MVIDTSILLAVVFNEKHGSWAVEQLERARSKLLMSTVNWAEFLIILRDRQPALADEVEDRVLERGIELVAPTRKQAEVAAAARLKYPLNLGDCFAYALAHTEKHKLITLDSDFRSTDIELVIPGK